MLNGTKILNNLSLMYVVIVIMILFNSLLQSSGVAVSDECKSKFEDVKKGKKYR